MLHTQLLGITQGTNIVFTHGLEEIDCHWEHFILNQMDPCVKQQVI